jgi:hypothetical protein
MTREWSVLVKVRTIGRAARIDRAGLEAVLGELTAADPSSTGGDGPDATISTWVVATDASEAVDRAWNLIEDARQRAGIEPWEPIRTHAASASQRLTGFVGVEDRVTDAAAWSILLKADRIDGPDFQPEQRLRLAAMLGRDAAVAGDTSTLVARFWVRGSDARDANEAARAALVRALHSLELGEWRLTRAHHAVASERAEEVYRGAAERAATEQGR